MVDKLERHDAVIAVDVQNDFCPGGALAVPGGDEIVPVLNEWFAQAERGGAAVVVTRDFHPDDHCSFESQGGPWPPHCVQGTRGAEYRADLQVPAGAFFIDKATIANQESYSAFDATGLADVLRKAGVTRLWIGGLALDVCVRATVLDALAEGFEVHVILPATRAVDVRPGDGDRALAEMESKGAVIERQPV